MNFFCALIISIVFNLVECTEKEIFFDQNDPIEPTQPCTPKFCSSQTISSKEVLDYCKSNLNFTIQSRCCLDIKNPNNTIIKGIDYTGCNIQKLNTAIESISRDSIQFVEILDLRNNSLIECNNESYAGFFNLQNLFIPNSCTCPGTNYSWMNVSNGACSVKINICNTSFPNVNCTSTSECVDNGPGNFLCNCKTGYHGYKCLNEGEFPTLLFTSLTCGLTIFLSAMLWHTQRRHVTKKNA